MNFAWYEIGIMIGFGLFLCITTLLYVINRDLYISKRIGIRKLYYLAILISAFILWVTKNFPVQTIGELTFLLVGVVLVDLFLFQTPDITKFLNQEFKHEELEKTASISDKLLTLTGEKILAINSVFPTGDEAWEETDFDFNRTPESRSSYESYVINYLNQYTQQFDITCLPFYVPSTNGNPDSLLANVEKTYDEIRARQENDFSNFNVGMRKRHLVRELKEANSIVFTKKEYKIDWSMLKEKESPVVQQQDSYVLVPFFGFYFNHIFVLKHTGELALNENDASLLLNMLSRIDYHLVQYHKMLYGQQNGE